VLAIHRSASCLPLAAAIVGCSLAMCACGGSGSDSTQSGSAGTNFLAFSKCMRSHGVPSFPDPSGGGGIHLPDNSNINPFSPSFKAAQAQCQELLPGGGPPRGASAQQKQRMLRTSQCMRGHGVTGFPDPSTTPPTGSHDYSLVEGIGGPTGGLYVLVPKTIDVNSPAFKRAAKACSF
jgi:hypothetical protein